MREPCFKVQVYWWSINQCLNKKLINCIEILDQGDSRYFFFLFSIYEFYLTHRKDKETKDDRWEISNSLERTAQPRSFILSAYPVAQRTAVASAISPEIKSRSFASSSFTAPPQPKPLLYILISYSFFLCKSQSPAQHYSSLPTYSSVSIIQAKHTILLKVPKKHINHT